MKKYRIKEVEGEFYPQYRVLGVWSYFHNVDFCELGYKYSEPHSFTSLKKAQKFLDERIEIVNTKKDKKYHYPPFDE